MEQKRNDAAVMGAQTKSSREECASSMGQRENTNNAVVRDVIITLRQEECAPGTEQRDIYAVM